jgi:hypothetical protein
MWKKLITWGKVIKMGRGDLCGKINSRNIIWER